MYIMNNKSKMEDVTHKSAGEICNNFLQESGLHGVNKLQKSASDWWRRIFWGCAILGCGIYLIVTITKEIQYFLTYPTTTSVDVDVVDELPFPAVTICNLSPYNRSKMNLDQKSHNFYVASNSRLSKFASPINWSDPYYKRNGFFEPESKRYLLHNISMELSKFLPNCFFDNIVKPCDEIFRPIFTGIGPCFTFNHDGMVHTSMNGAGYNLEVEAFIDQKNYFYGILDLGSGVKVIIHEPGNKPDVQNDGLIVHPGTLASISINKHKFEFLPKPYKAFKSGHCVDVGACTFKNPLQYSNYSLVSCIEECYNEKLEKVANCTIVYIHGKKRVCSKYEYYNLLDYIAHIEATRTFGAVCLKKCRLPCTYTRYEPQISFSQYPSDFMHSEFQRLVDPSYKLNEQRNNYLRVKVFYEKLVTVTTRQVAVFSSWEQILANLGGQMGLFLGASIITVSEFLELGVKLMLYLCRKTTRKTKINDTTNVSVKH